MQEVENIFFPIMGVNLTENNTVKLDLSVNNAQLKEIDFINSRAFGDFIASQMAAGGYTFAIGGYAENRAIYTRSEVFSGPASSYRNIHLGIDIWTSAGRPVFCPLTGKVHSFQDNASFGNYGPTIILEHQLHDASVIYSLYGHLIRIDLKKLKVGQSFDKGEQIGHLGAMEENGDWPPHLHFQLIRDIGDYTGDYPGVCGEKDKSYCLSNCPDPHPWLKCVVPEP
jgi:murein DD-endopeptidase MepM/ murein hydrolase activator NlpD